MAEQLPLFDRDASDHIRPDPSRKNPVVWVKEVILLKKFDPATENLIQRIELRPGINILWAKPEQRTRKPKLGQRGTAGHASGKTLFCRFLRYVLGEKKFATNSIQAKVRKHFEEGHVAAEVIINGNSWLVCLPFSGHQGAWAAEGATAEKLFDSSLKRTKYNTFLSVLTRTAFEPLKVKTFPSTESRITWPHLLPWLTRDQECRFAKLPEWRDPMSESEAPELVVEERQHLMRSLLDIVSPKEQELLEENARLVHQRDDAKKNVPLLQHQSRVDYGRLKKLIRHLRPPDKIDELFTNQVNQDLKNQETAAENEYKRAVTSLKIPQLTEKRDRTLESFRKAKDEIDERSTALEKAQNDLKTKKENPSAKLDSLLGKYPSTELFCKVPLYIAIEKCPLRQDPTLKFGKESAMLHFDDDIPSLEKNVAFWTERVKEQAKVRDESQKQYLAANTSLNDKLAERNRLFETLATKRSEFRHIESLTRNAVLAKEAAERLDASISGLDVKINKTYREANDIRQKRESDIQRFSTTFDLFVKALMGEEVRGVCEFSGRNIALRVENRGDITSAAIETIKLLAFDLAAVASSVQGLGFHPRFLVHDGPREADMSPRIYDHFFILARLIEDAFPNGTEPNFQYIITTTTPPPDDMQLGSKWLLKPVLDASSPFGRLLKIDL
jgi:hypothetical protein